MRNSSVTPPATGKRRSVSNGSSINPAGSNRNGEAKPKTRKSTTGVSGATGTGPNRKPMPKVTSNAKKKVPVHAPLGKKPKSVYGKGKKDISNLNKYMLTPQISDMNMNLLRKISSARMPVPTSGRSAPSGGATRHSLENNTSIPLFAPNSPYMGREFSPEEVQYYDAWAPFKAPSATTVQQLSVEDRLLLLGVRPGSTAAQLCEHWEQQLTQRFLGDEDFSFLDENDADPSAVHASSWPPRKEKHLLDKNSTWWAPLTVPEALMNSMRPSTASAAFLEKESPAAAALKEEEEEEEPSVQDVVVPPSPHSHIPYPPQQPLPRNSIEGSNASGGSLTPNSVKRASRTNTFAGNGSKGYNESCASEPPWVKNTTPQGAVHAFATSYDDPLADDNDGDEDENESAVLPSPPKHKQPSLSSPQSRKPKGSRSSSLGDKEKPVSPNKIGFSEVGDGHDGPHRTANGNGSPKGGWVGQDTIDRRFNQLENDLGQLADYQGHQLSSPRRHGKGRLGSHATDQYEHDDTDDDDDHEEEEHLPPRASYDKQPSPSTINRKFTELEGDLVNMKVESPRRRRSMQRNATTDPSDEEEAPGALKEAHAIRLNHLLGDSSSPREKERRRPETSPVGPTALALPSHSYLPNGRVVVMSLGPITPIASELNGKQRIREESHSGANSIAGSPIAYGPKKKNNAGRRLPPIQ